VTRPSLETQPQPAAVGRGIVYDYCFRDALPTNLREVYDLRFMGNASVEHTAETLGRSRTFVRWATTVCSRRLREYAAQVHGSVSHPNTPKTVAAAAANAPGQVLNLDEMRRAMLTPADPVPPPEPEGA